MFGKRRCLAGGQRARHKAHTPSGVLIKIFFVQGGWLWWSIKTVPALSSLDYFTAKVICSRFVAGLALSATPAPGKPFGPLQSNYTHALCFERFYLKINNEKIITKFLKVSVFGRLLFFGMLFLGDGKKKTMNF